MSFDYIRHDFDVPVRWSFSKRKEGRKKKENEGHIAVYDNVKIFSWLKKQGYDANTVRKIFQTSNTMQVKIIFLI
jgi:hypothetical protein